MNFSQCFLTCKIEMYLILLILNVIVHEKLLTNMLVSVQKKWTCCHCLLYSIMLLLQTPEFIIVVIRLFLPHSSQDFIEILVTITAYQQHKLVGEKDQSGGVSHQEIPIEHEDWYEGDIYFIFFLCTKVPGADKAHWSWNSDGHAS